MSNIFLNTMLLMARTGANPSDFIKETITLVTGLAGGGLLGLGIMQLILALKDHNPAGKHGAFLEIASGGALLVLGPKIADFIVSYFN